MMFQDNRISAIFFTSIRKQKIKAKSIARIGFCFGVLFSSFLIGCTSQTSAHQKEYQVGVCDWMILKRQKIGSFKLSSEIGAEGIELDMGSLGSRVRFDSKLDDSLGQRQFHEEAEKYQQKIASIAMSGFYGQSFATRAEYESLTLQAIRTAVAMGTDIVFLPLGVHSNLKTNPELRDTLIHRLKIVGDLAAEENVVIAIATSLPAAEDIALLKDIDSKGIKISVNFSDIIENGLDISSELRTWGAENIAQIHCSNTDGYWIENDPAINLHAVKESLDSMNWRGWLLIERSRDPEIVRDVKANFSANVSYVKSVFQPTTNL